MIESSVEGNPKGAMLTHENVVADAAGVLKTFEVYLVFNKTLFVVDKCHQIVFNLVPQTSIVPNPDDITISFLPLAHMFERVVQVRDSLNWGKSEFLFNSKHFHIQFQGPFSSWDI